MRAVLDPEPSVLTPEVSPGIATGQRTSLFLDEDEDVNVTATSMGAVETWRDQLVVKTVALLLRHRWFAAALIAASGVAAGVATLRIDPWYVATATIFPAAQSSPMSALGIAGIANLVGLGGGMGGSSQFPIYENVVHSERLLSDLLAMPLPEHGGTLLEHLEIAEADPTLRAAIALGIVRESVEYDTDKKTGLVLIRYRDRDPEVAALAANRVLDLLNEFDLATSSDLANARRRFVDARLAEARDSLQLAERQLESFAAENLRIGRAPDLLLAQARLERELNIRQEVYLALRKEAEMARIEEQRTVPVISVLDHASVPLAPAGPSLVRNVVLGLFLGTLGTLAIFAFVALSPRQMLGRLQALANAR